MTVWVLHRQLTPQEEAEIAQHTYLELPFEGVPDLSAVTSQGHAMQLLRLLHPDDPPESLTRRMDRFWDIYGGLHKEDLIAVPLKGRGEMALAEVTGGYEYKVGERGADVHLIPVKWHERRIPLTRLSKHKEIFDGGRAMYEVVTLEARTALRDYLPHSYNRFVRMKWLLALFFLMNLIGMLKSLMTN